jgi:hypothetical protein
MLDSILNQLWLLLNPRARAKQLVLFTLDTLAEEAKSKIDDTLTADDIVDLVVEQLKLKVEELL